MMFDFGIRAVVNHRFGTLFLWDAGGYVCTWAWHNPHTGQLQPLAPGSLAAPIWAR